MKSMYDPIRWANKDAVIKTVTNPDGACIWDPSTQDADQDNEDDDDAKPDVQIQEEGVPAPPDWVGSHPELDTEIDKHQMDNFCMLLKCHAEMLERQAMLLSDAEQTQ